MRATGRPSRALPMSICGGRFRRFQNKGANLSETHRRFGRTYRATAGRSPADGTSHAKVARCPPILIIGSQNWTASSTASVELGAAPEVGNEAGCTASDLVRDMTLNSELVSLTQTQGFPRPKTSLLEPYQRDWLALLERELSGSWKALRSCFPDGQNDGSDILKPAMHFRGRPHFPSRPRPHPTRVATEKKKRRSMLLRSLGLHYILL